MNNSQVKHVAIIMAGGLGVRLWPRSTEENPKQYTHLIGDGTLLQNTYSRLRSLFEVDDIYIAAVDSYKKLVETQIPELPKENIISEPFLRNTAPCLALSCSFLNGKYNENDIIAAFPSDHIINNKREFFESVELAFEAAETGNKIITIGIQPTRPETSFGYIQIKNDNDFPNDLYNKGLRFTNTFAEKPDADTAQRFIQSGDFLWNSGIFIMSFGTFWSAIDKYIPDYSLIFKNIKDKTFSNYDESVDEIYRQVHSVSFDYAVLEKADNVYVVQSSFAWSDVGNWDEIYRLSMKDPRGNVIEGDVISIENSNCFIRSNGRMIGAVGVKDLVIIDSGDAILICKRGHTDEVMDLIDYMKRKNINMYL